MRAPTPKTRVYDQKERGWTVWLAHTDKNLHFDIYHSAPEEGR